METIRTDSTELPPVKRIVQPETIFSLWKVRWLPDITWKR